MPAHSPTVRRHRLGMELRRLRHGADLTIEQVAARLECSNSKISRIETGQVSATPRDVRDMLEMYGVGDQQRTDLVQIAREARQKDWWWHAFGDVPVPIFVAFEAEAFSMSSYQSLVVPGLLQTEEYARAVLQAIHPELAPDLIERRMDLHMARQSILTKKEPPTLRIVLDEASLRRFVGGPDVMRQQLKRVSEVGVLPHVTLQVLPFTIGEHAGMEGSFTVLEFRDPADPSAVYVEMPTSDLWLEDIAVVRHYERLLALMRSVALSEDESAAFISKVSKEL